MPRSLLSGADGAVRSTTDLLLGLNNHPVCASSVASRLFLDRAAFPSFKRRGFSSPIRPYVRRLPFDRYPIDINPSDIHEATPAMTAPGHQIGEPDFVDSA
jgi:hypothetical protein